MIRPEDFWRQPKYSNIYVGKHRTPEIPKGVYGVSLGSRKRGMWLNEVADRDSDPNVR